MVARDEANIHYYLQDLLTVSYIFVLLEMFLAPSGSPFPLPIHFITKGILELILDHGS